jgi:PAS domain S-box-containing protein
MHSACVTVHADRGSVGVAVYAQDGAMARDERFIEGQRALSRRAPARSVLVWLPRSWRDPRLPAAAAALGAAYYVGAKIGFALTFQPNPISVLWPPNSMLLAALLLTPVSWWCGLLATAFVAHLAAELQGGVPLAMVLCWFVSNSSEALLGAGAMRLLLKGPPRLDRLWHVAVFLAFCVLLAPFLSSFLDAGFVRLIGWGEAQYWEVWRLRFSSNALAALVLVPVIVGWWSTEQPRSSRRLVEGSVLALLLVAVSAVVLGAQTEHLLSSPALLYAPLPLLLWAAVRFGPRGASASILLVAAFAILDAANGFGPFAAGSSAENALSIQLFLMVVSVPLLTLAAAIEERSQAQEALRRNEERVSAALSAAKTEVAERKRAEDALSQVIEKHRLATEAGAVGVWDWDLETNEIYVEPVLKARLGYADHEIRNHMDDWGARVHPEDASAVMERAQAHIQGRTAEFQAEHRMLHKDGGTRWFIARGQVQRDAGGKPVRMLGTDTDITERKQAELEAREQRVQLAHLTRVATLGELSGALAHELNQPLTAILSNAQACRHLLAREPVDVAELREILDDIVQDDKRAGEVIRRLRALLEKGEAQLHPLDLNEVVRDVMVLAHADLINRNVAVNLQLATDLAQIRGDRIQLQQVLLNLIVNACDAMQATPAAGRTIGLATSSDSDGWVRLAVSDSGHGILANARDRIFEPFFSTKETGLGLGLAVCRSIVTAHGGRLSGGNNRVSGATFALLLPALADMGGSTPPLERRGG